MSPLRTLVSLAAFVLITLSVPAAAGLRPGVELSGSFARVSRIDEASGDEIFEPRFGAGWSAGVTVEWPVSRHVAVASGLRYSNTAGNERVGFTGTGGGVGGDLRETWHRLTLPLSARITPWGLPLSFDLGPEIAVLLQAKSELELDAGSMPLRGPRGAIRAAANADIFEDVGTFSQEDVTDRYHRVDYVFGGGMRYAWPMRSGRLVAHARYGFGLGDIMKSDAMERRTQSMEVGAGWQW